MNVIEPAKSEWSGPVVFTPEKDGALRFYVNHRKLNPITVRDSNPIPLMDECIDAIGDVWVFSTLDASSGHLQVEVDEADCDEMAFASPHGLYCFFHMLMGLKNASGTLHYVMDIILATVKWQFALATWTKLPSFWSPWRNMSNMYVKYYISYQTPKSRSKFKECFFSAKNTDYLRHIIRPGRLSIAIPTSGAICD